MTAVASAVLFRSESKGSGFNANRNVFNVKDGRSIALCLVSWSWSNHMFQFFKDI